MQDAKRLWHKRICHCEQRIGVVTIPAAPSESCRPCQPGSALRGAIEQYVEDASAKTSYLAVDGGVTVGVAVPEQHFPESSAVQLVR